MSYLRFLHGAYPPPPPPLRWTHQLHAEGNQETETLNKKKLQENWGNKQRLIRAQFTPPEKFNFSNGQWDEWKNSFETYRVVTELDKKAEIMQVMTLKYCMGPEIEGVIKTFNLTKDQMKDYKHVIEKLDNYSKPKKNGMRLRQKFTRRVQLGHEDVEEFLRELYKCAEPHWKAWYALHGQQCRFHSIQSAWIFSHLCGHQE